MTELPSIGTAYRNSFYFIKQIVVSYCTCNLAVSVLSVCAA